jgi:dTMP kinase
VNGFNQFALGGLVPDLTFLCLLPPEEGRARLQQDHTDRLDRETLNFHRLVYDAYRQMAASAEKRFQVLDATLSPEALLNQAIDRLKRLEHGLLRGL